MITLDILRYLGKSIAEKSTIKFTYIKQNGQFSSHTAIPRTLSFRKMEMWDDFEKDGGDVENIPIEQWVLGVHDCEGEQYKDNNNKWFAVDGMGIPESEVRR